MELLRQRMLRNNGTQTNATETSKTYVIRVNIGKQGTNQTSSTKDNELNNSTVQNSTSVTTRDGTTSGDEIRSRKHFSQVSTPPYWITESHEVTPRTYYKEKPAAPGISPTTIIPILAAVASFCFCTLELIGTARKGKTGAHATPEAQSSAGETALPSGGPGKESVDVQETAMAA